MIGRGGFILSRKLVIYDVICDYKKEDLMTLQNISKKSDLFYENEVILFALFVLLIKI